MPSDPYIVIENVRPPNCHRPLKPLLGFFVWFGFVLVLAVYILVLFYFHIVFCCCFYCCKNTKHEIYHLRCLRTQYSIVNVSAMLYSRSLELIHLV